MSATLPAAVIDAWLVQRGPYEVESVQPGMSGARVFRCTAADGSEIALKRWPLGTLNARIATIHRVITFARDAGLNLVPPLCFTRHHQQSLQVGSDHWDATAWMPGCPLPADASPAAIGRGAEAIAAFHQAVAPLHATVAAPPAIDSRLQRLRQLRPLIPQLPTSIRELPSLIDQSHDRSGPSADPPDTTELLATLQTACSLIQLNWNEVEVRMTRSLLQYAQRPMANQWVLRDVHRDNVLFKQQESGGELKPAALIDFDAVRVDVPATDLARWIGSFMADSLDREATWEAALEGFARGSRLFSDSRPSDCGTMLEGGPNHRQLSREKDLEKERLRALTECLLLATTWISLANWLVWILLEQRRFDAGPTAIALRLKHLIATAKVCFPEDRMKWQR